MEDAHHPMLMFRMGAKEAERIVQAAGQEGMQSGVSLDGGTRYCKMRSHVSIIRVIAWDGDRGDCTRAGSIYAVGARFLPGNRGNRAWRWKQRRGLRETSSARPNATLSDIWQAERVYSSSRSVMMHGTNSPCVAGAMLRCPAPSTCAQCVLWRAGVFQTGVAPARTIAWLRGFRTRVISF